MEPQDLDRVRFVTRHFNDLQGLRWAVPLGLVALSLGGSIHFAGWPAYAVLLTALGALLLRLGARRWYTHSFGTVDAQPAYVPGELHTLSIYSPAGPTQRLVGFQQMRPVTRHFLATIGLMVTLIYLFEYVPPNLVITGSEAMGRHPQVQPVSPDVYDPPIEWMAALGGLFKSPGTFRAVYAQVAYAFFAAIFLAVWLWRERRPSQRYHLVLGALLLGLALLGASLGFFARGGPPPAVDFLLPALVYPGIALLLCGAALVAAGLLDHFQLVRALGRPVEDLR
jgi:hypothetical protein